jgi:hypothetical protein
VSCDARSITCERLAPNCPQGQVPSAVGSCYGPCVAIEACGCTTAAECPDANQYTCHLFARRCGPFLN